MSHIHCVYDNDTHFKINPHTRVIENTSEKVIIMQNDHNSERFTFEIPRYIDGHDMSLCNKVQVHFNNIKADKTETTKDVYTVEDLQISPDSDEVVICSWLISQNATKYAGALNFVLRYACLTDTVIDYQWYTDIHKGITVSESISNNDTAATEYFDLLEQWKKELEEEFREEFGGGGTGTDGYSPSAKVTQTSTGATITITDKSGTTAANITNGEDGVGIQSVVQTTTSTADGGSNVVTVTLTDGRTSTFTVRNGSKGSSGTGGESVPGYVIAEAETVARIVNEHQSNDSIVFPFLADAHCGFYQDRANAAATLAGQLLNHIGKRVPYDFIVNGGDMANGAFDTTKVLSFDQIEDYTELTSEAHKGVPSIWVPGNHDDAPYQATASRVSQKEMFALIGRKNRVSGAVCPNGCNYGYLDFENRKLRVIYLDTDEKRSWGTVTVGAGGNCDYLNAHNCSGEQLRWLATTALNFSGKQNVAEWGIVVASHVSLDISGTYIDAVSGASHTHSTANAAKILGAYKTGKSGSITHGGVTVTYDFSSVGERANIICAVHGHNHKFSNEMVSGILSIGCPNVMNGRERESADGNTYTKIAGTADGTSFCIITIDRENSVIYADCVGAGYDREFAFSTSAVAYTNQIPISTDTDGSVFNGVGYQAGYRLGSSGTLSEQSNSYVTGFIPCKKGDIIHMKNITFQYGVTDGLSSSNQRLSFYDANKAHVVQTHASGLSGTASGVKGEDNIWTQFTVNASVAGTDMSNVAFFRINAAYIGADSIITVNEEIV